MFPILSAAFFFPISSLTPHFPHFCTLQREEKEEAGATSIRDDRLKPQNLTLTTPACVFSWEKEFLTLFADDSYAYEPIYPQIVYRGAHEHTL